jgi:F-type H+-transporting ATPase subunit c
MKNSTKAIIASTAALLATTAAQAQEAAHATGAGDKGLVGLSAGLAIGLAAIGGALGQGKTAAAALDGIARNPAAQSKIFTPMIIGLALIESLVIYAFVISFFLQGKI